MGASSFFWCGEKNDIVKVHLRERIFKSSFFNRVNIQKTAEFQSWCPTAWIFMKFERTCALIDCANFAALRCPDRLSYLKEILLNLPQTSKIKVSNKQRNTWTQWTELISKSLHLLLGSVFRRTVLSGNKGHGFGRRYFFQNPWTIHNFIIERSQILLLWCPKTIQDLPADSGQISIFFLLQKKRAFYVVDRDGPEPFQIKIVHGFWKKYCRPKPCTLFPDSTVNA